MAASDVKKNNSGSPAVVTIEDFDRIYHQYRQVVYANIFKMVRHVETAEDLLQEVFLSLWKSREKINSDGVAGWLFVVSYNKAATCLKDKLRHSFIISGEAAGPEPPFPDDLSNENIYQLQLSLIRDALLQLPARKKDAFHLHYFEGRSHEEIASLLDISIASAKDYIKQAGLLVREYTSRNYGSSVSAMMSFLAFTLMIS